MHTCTHAHTQAYKTLGKKGHEFERKHGRVYGMVWNDEGEGRNDSVT